MCRSSGRKRQPSGVTPSLSVIDRYKVGPLWVSVYYVRDRGTCRHQTSMVSFLCVGVPKWGLNV